MTTVSAVTTKVRMATAASAIVAAATLMPAVANASPAAPLPAAGIGNTLNTATVAPCAPSDVLCNLVAPGNSSAAAIPQTPFVWFGPANPNFQPLFGIVFPNFFGLNFEACIFGAAVHLSPYGTGFIGLGLGC
jgi:hypothetical protein